jgi:hypothetical protein
LRSPRQQPVITARAVNCCVSSGADGSMGKGSKILSSSVLGSFSRVVSSDTALISMSADPFFSSKLPFVYLLVTPPREGSATSVSLPAMQETGSEASMIRVTVKRAGRVDVPLASLAAYLRVTSARHRMTGLLSLCSNWWHWHILRPAIALSCLSDLRKAAYLANIASSQVLSAWLCAQLTAWSLASGAYPS